MKNSERFDEAFEYFKQNYCYKMGGTQTVILPNGKQRSFDDRQYYQGRGSKYNSSIRHDEKGDTKVTRKEYSAFLKELKDRELVWEERAFEQLEQLERIEGAAFEGLYSLNKDGYVELTDQERINQAFDHEKLANTLNISVEDALLLNSQGKTYVLANKIGTNKVYQLYHPDLMNNDLSIHVEFVTEERVESFDHNEWASAPFAGLVGQSLNENHFVC